MIQCKGPCNRLLNEKYFYRTGKGRIQQPCKHCLSERRYTKLAEHASLSATMTAIQPPVVSLSNTDMDLY